MRAIKLRHPAKYWCFLFCVCLLGCQVFKPKSRPQSQSNVQLVSILPSSEDANSETPIYKFKERFNAAKLTSVLSNELSKQDDSSVPIELRVRFKDKYGNIWDLHVVSRLQNNSNGWKYYTEQNLVSEYTGIKLGMLTKHRSNKSERKEFIEDIVHSLT